MRIVASVSGNIVALYCKPLWRKAYVVYASPYVGEAGHIVWMLGSGRECSGRMLNAIDRLPEATKIRLKP